MIVRNKKIVILSPLKDGENIIADLGFYNLEFEDDKNYYFISNNELLGIEKILENKKFIIRGE